MYINCVNKMAIFMIINKVYKFRLYPNEKQKEMINKTFGCTRFVDLYIITVL